jgi:hypothetical protein
VPAPEGVRVIVDLDLSLGECELQLNMTGEGVIADVYVGMDTVPVNAGTSSETYEEIGERLTSPSGPAFHTN